MRPFTHTIPFAEALALTLEAARPIARTEIVELSDALDRVTAEAVRADHDVPPFSRSAMDGYAVRAADTAGASAAAPRVLQCIGRVFTGEVWDGDLEAGTCLEIATGAPVPAGADAVVMVERTQRPDSDAAPDAGGPFAVHVLESASERQHIGRQGNDLRAGDEIVPAGARLDPARVGALAAAGVARVAVYARPEVALVSTGNELVLPGAPLLPGRIHEVNRFTLAAVVRQHGGDARPLPSAGDTLEALHAALDAALTSDVVVFSGGSSVGNRDLLRDAIGARGDVRYHGIAVKPGKPTMLAEVEGRPVFGMPGNPTSCLSNGYLLLAPFLRRMAHLPAWQPRRVEGPLATTIRSASDRHQFYTVRLEKDGRIAPAFKGSGEITSMAHADGYIEIPPGTDELAAGARVTVTLFGPRT